MATVLSALLFIVIGSCFTTFIYKNEMIKVEDIKLHVFQGMEVFNADGDKAISELKLSDMKLGLKPATGEEDKVTSIPATVTDKQGSEGQYATFCIYAPAGAKAYITNIKIENHLAKEDISKERENIKVAIDKLESEAVSLKEDKVFIGDIEPSDERQKMVLYVWLTAKAGDLLKGSKISFDITFEQS